MSIFQVPDKPKMKSSTKIKLYFAFCLLSIMTKGWRTGSLRIQSALICLQYPVVSLMKIIKKKYINPKNLANFSFPCILSLTRFFFYQIIRAWKFNDFVYIFILASILYWSVLKENLQFKNCFVVYTWYIYIKKYYSATEENEILFLATKCLLVEIIFLSEIGQIWHVFHKLWKLICRVEKCNAH